MVGVARSFASAARALSALCLAALASSAYVLSAAGQRSRVSVGAGRESSPHVGRMAGSPLLLMRGDYERARERAAPRAPHAPRARMCLVEELALNADIRA